MAKNEKSEAAEKIEKAAKAKKNGAPKAKKGNIFVRIGKWFAKFGKDFKGDVKKITWPNGMTVLKSTLVVILCIAIIGIAVFVVDFGLSKGLDGIGSLANNYKSSSEAADESDSDKAEADKAADTTKEASEDAAAAADSE